MPSRPTDRRVQRTRKLLQDALIAMIVEKGYEATTVQDIIDKANVGRATFYAHFADKQTLLTSRLEDLRVSLLQQQEQSPGNLAYSLAMLEHAREHLPVYKAIVGRESGALVVQRLHQMIADLASLEITTRVADQRELAAQYVAGAFMAVLRWWLDRGAKRSPQDVNEVFRRLLMRGLARGLE
jgi:AcrR family transcriptional regulator